MEKLFIWLSFFIVLIPNRQVYFFNPKIENTNASLTKLYKPLVKEKIITGAEQTEVYISSLKNKKIALVVNQTSVISSTHLVDSLLTLKFNIVKIFSPEHGFRGNAANGEHVSNETDVKTGLPI